MGDEPPTANPARVVADADVLAADLLVDGDAREALDLVRSHSWVELVASDSLLDDAEAVVAAVAADDLAADWRDAAEALRVRVEHPEGDHPGLAAAYRGDAAHLLTYDEELGSARAGAAINRRMPLSVRPPDAFVAVFDAESVHREVVGGEYEGPDRDPRA